MNVTRSLIVDEKGVRIFNKAIDEYKLYLILGIYYEMRLTFIIEKQHTPSKICKGWAYVIMFKSLPGVNLKSQRGS